MWRINGCSVAVNYRERAGKLGVTSEGKGAGVGTERQVVTGRWRHAIESDDDVP
jgi:hypothetical protein